jgi:hypothetical protein
MKPIITKHAYKRAKKRVGWNKHAMDRMAARILAQGISITSAPCAALYAFLAEHKTDDFCDPIIYGQFLYIWRNSQEGEKLLLTAYEVPQDIRRLLERN